MSKEGGERLHKKMKPILKIEKFLEICFLISSIQINYLVYFMHANKWLATLNYFPRSLIIKIWILYKQLRTMTICGMNTFKHYCSQILIEHMHQHKFCDTLYFNRYSKISFSKFLFFEWNAKLSKIVRLAF